MANPSFTPIMDPVSTIVHYNVSHMVATQPLQMTTFPVWIVMSILGICLLIYSIKHHEDMEGDITGILAAPILLLSAWQSFMVDTVTSYGVSGVYMGNVTKLPDTVFVSLESHQIYHYDLWGYLLGLFFVVSVANLFLLWLRHERITKQPTDPIDHRDLSKRVGAEQETQSQNPK